MDRETIGKFSSDINTVATKAHGLLENLLGWTRVKTGRLIFNPVEFNLHPIVEDVFHFNYENAKGKGIALLNIVKVTDSVFADVNMLTVILRNLISNAIKFTGTNGRISVTTEQQDGQLKIAVTDNGLGISPEDLSKLFDENIQYSGTGTHHEKGTGLGLLLCKEFIEKHGGKLKADSKLGEGTQIYFTLGIRSLIEED